MSTIEWAGGIPGTYSLNLGTNWMGNKAPGTGDNALFAAAATGPYTLTGSGLYQSATFGGDDAVLEGSIATTAPLGLLVDAGSDLTIAAGAGISNHGSLQIGGTSMGALDLYGSLSSAGATLLSQGTLGLDGGTLTGTLYISGGVLRGGASTTISDNIYIGSGGAIIAAATGTTLTVAPATFSAQALAGLGPVITIGAAGAAGVVVVDPANLVLPSQAGAVFDVAGGTLREAGSTLLRSRPVTIEAGATLDVIGNADTTDGLYGSGAIENSGADTPFEVAGGIFAGTIEPGIALNIQNAFTFSGTDLSTDNWVIAGGVVQLGTGGSAGTIAAAAIQALSAATLSFDQGQNFTLASNLSGALSVVDTGPGEVTLTGMNNYSGITSIASGAMLIAGGSAALGSGNIIDSGSLETEQTASLANSFSMTTGAVLAAAAGTTLTIQGAQGSTINLTGTVTFGAPGETGVIALGSYTDQSIDIADGTLRELGTEVVGNGGLDAGTLDIAAGATLDLNGFSRRELSGNIAGDIISSVDGGVIAFGSATISGTIGAGVELDLNAGVSSVTLTGTDISGSYVNIPDSTSVLQLGDGGGGGVFEASTIYDTGRLVIDRSDTLTLDSYITTAGTLIDEGSGLLILGGTNDYSGGTTLGSGAHVLATNAAAFGAGTIFLSGSDTLEFGAGYVANTIVNFGPQDVLDLDGVTASSLEYVTGVGLIVTDTNHVGHIVKLAGSLATSDFSYTDTAQGTEIEYLTCFAEGSRILTPAGEIAVETLRPGMEVVTAGCAVKEIRWIGHRHIDLRNFRDKRDLYLVRIVAGAFAPDVPRRDLLVTQEHCILVDGGLIPARLLVNGVSIYFDHGIEEFAYYHVELEEHDILLAEGLPAESYLDTGNRGNFANAQSALLRPDFALTERHKSWADAAVPLVTDRMALEAVWRRLTARTNATRLAPQMQMTNDPDLIMETPSGAVIRPLPRAGDRYFFRLPPGTVDLHLRCRTARPSEITPYIDDRRDLGVLVGEIAYHAGGAVHNITAHLQNAKLPGWFRIEQSESRWSGGCAALPRLPGAPKAMLEIQIMRAGPYFLPTERNAA